MEANYTQYDYKKSIERIDDVLNSSDANYEDHTGIPVRSKLTFSNGFYVDVTVLFVDMRGSKDLSEKHTRPVLAKIYRSYISEIVAVLNGNPTVHEIYIEGDGVWAVFNTTTKSEVDSVFCTAFTISSLVDILNVKLKKKKYSTINIGIGLEDGKSLYIKAGNIGSTINEVIWIGKTVGQAAKLCSSGNRTYSDKEMMVSTLVYSSLTEYHQSLLSWNPTRECYHGDIIHLGMNAWVNENE
jgi:class 3 adenylate cyclase